MNKDWSVVVEVFWLLLTTLFSFSHKKSLTAELRRVVAKRSNKTNVTASHRTHIQRTQRSNSALSISLVSHLSFLLSHWEARKVTLSWQQQKSCKRAAHQVIKQERDNKMLSSSSSYSALLLCAPPQQTTTGDTKCAAYIITIMQSAVSHYPAIVVTPSCGVAADAKVFPFGKERNAAGFIF